MPSSSRRAHTRERIAARGLPGDPYEHQRTGEPAEPQSPEPAVRDEDIDAAEARLPAIADRDGRARLLGWILARRVARGDLTTWAEVAARAAHHLGEPREDAWIELLWAFAANIAPARDRLDPSIPEGCLEIARTDALQRELTMEYLVTHLCDRRSLPSFLAALRALPPAERIRPLLAAARSQHAGEPASAGAIVADAVAVLRSLPTSERGGHLDSMLPLRALVPLRDGLAEWTAMLVPHLRPASMPLLYLWPSDHTEALQWFAGDAALVAAAQAIEEVALTFPRIRRR